MDKFEKSEGKFSKSRGGDREDRGGRGGRGRDRDRDSDGDDRGGRRSFGGGFGRRKVCRFCTDSDFNLDYKNIRAIQSFMTEHGKIVPRRISGTCALHQRKLTVAIKRAQNLALVGFTNAGA